MEAKTTTSILDEPIKEEQKIKPLKPTEYKPQKSYEEELKEIIKTQSNRIKELENMLALFTKELRKKRKQQKTINKHQRKERAIQKRKELEYKRKRTNRSVRDILLNKWIYLINHPLDYQAVDYAVQEIRKKHPATPHYSKYIKQRVYTIYSREDIINALNSTYKTYSHAFKINVSFGLVFERSIDESGNFVQVILHEPSNSFYLSEPRVIKNAADMQILINRFSDQTLKDHYETLAPNTQTKLIGIYAMSIKLTLLSYAIGAKVDLPNYILKSKWINSLTDVENNMCFWACLALMKGCRKDRYKKEMKELFIENYKSYNHNYPGFDYVSELDKLETNMTYAINIVNFKEDGEIEYVKKSNYNYTRKAKYINLCQNHFSYITNFENLGKIFTCAVCGYRARHPSEIDRHTCHKETTDYFVNPYNSLWSKPRNTIIELGDYYEVDVADFKYDYLVTFDLEALLLKIDINQSESLKFVTKHIPISCSIASNIPGYTKEKFIISTTPHEICEKMFKYFDILQKTASDLMYKKYQDLTDKMRALNRIKDVEKLREYIDSLPIIGFNSSFYDIGLLSNYGCMHEIKKRCDKPFIIKSGVRYKVIKTTQFTFLDQMNYCAPGTSLDKFVRAYDIKENKGFFPYEWFDSYDKLDYKVEDLTRNDFYSSLKNKTINQKEFDNLIKDCKQKNIIYIRDLLEWYNNLDVRPMLEACLKNKEFYYGFGIDMYKDGFSLPSLAETILYQFSIKDFDAYLTKDMPKNECTNVMIDDSVLSNKIRSYKKQDNEAKRSLDNYIDIKGFKRLLQKFRYHCHYCWQFIVVDNLSLDRIDNSKAHTEDNCVIACTSCNKRRKDELYKKFYREKAMIRFSREVPLIHLIDEDNKEVFYKLRESICGGLSLVFHRYHEKDVTKIQRTKYDEENDSWYVGKETGTVKKIVGYDANALYLWCLGQEMLCDKLELIITNDMKYVDDNDFFGFLEVDIEVPKHLYNYFSELPPITKNAEYDENICGEYTRKLLEKLNKKPHKTRKLVATMKGEKIVIKSTRLKWLLNKGCVVSKLHSVIPATPRRCFEGFMNWVADERRKGDKDITHAIIAEGAKLVGNSAFGHTIMNKSKHKKVILSDENTFNRYKNLARYYDATDYRIGEDVIYEITLTKKSQRQNIPLMIGCSVFDDSKLRMYQFCYDFIDKFIDRSHFQYLEMDTDSAYMALTDEFDKLVKPEMRKIYENEKYNWFCRNDTEEIAAYEKRIPGKMKIEYEGDGMICLCSKSYITWNKNKHKSSCKGAQKCSNTYAQAHYFKCLMNEENQSAINKGFRIKDKEMMTYVQKKIGLTPVYNKGVVLDNKINITPLNI